MKPESTWPRALCFFPLKAGQISTAGSSADSPVQSMGTGRAPSVCLTHTSLCGSRPPSPGGRSRGIERKPARRVAPGAWAGAWSCGRSGCSAGGAGAGATAEATEPVPVPPSPGRDRGAASSRQPPSGYRARPPCLFLSHLSCPESGLGPRGLRAWRFLGIPSPAEFLSWGYTPQPLPASPTCLALALSHAFTNPTI